MKICFLDSNPNPYNSKNLYSKNIRGAESILINLASNFNILGHKVFVFNNSIKKTTINGVNWSNLKSIKNDDYYDLAITNNDIRLLDLVKSHKKVAFSHSIQTLEKFIRKKQLISYLKNKPQVILLGKYHNENRNFFLKLFGSIKIEWAVDQIFLDSEINFKNSNRAIFTSRQDRNLDKLIHIWKNYIFTKNPKKKLYITPFKEDLTKFNIFNRTFAKKKKLINELLCSRMMLVPGHKAELFCIAAEEARELCLPIVTLGIGSLKERVKHGITGFIAKNYSEFGYYSNLLFNDNKLHFSIKKNLIKLRGSKKWNKIAKNLLVKITS